MEDIVDQLSHIARSFSFFPYLWTAAIFWFFWLASPISQSNGRFTTWRGTFWWRKLYFKKAIYGKIRVIYLLVRVRYTWLRWLFCISALSDPKSLYSQTWCDLETTENNPFDFENLRSFWRFADLWKWIAPNPLAFGNTILNIHTEKFRWVNCRTDSAFIWDIWSNVGSLLQYFEIGPV